MTIDFIYQTVQAYLNKEQLGYLKPLHFNLFIRKAQRTIYNRYLTDLKSNVRKTNWGLDGKDLANMSEHSRQLVEYFSTESEPITPPFLLPVDLEYIEDVFTGETRVEKINYSDFKDLQRNIYAKPNECSPKGSLVGEKLRVSPDTIAEIEVHYLRQPKSPKWTFVEFQGKAMFDPDKSDFQDIDMPPSAEDELVSLVSISASKYLRNLQMAQLEISEQNIEEQIDNKQ